MICIIGESGSGKSTIAKIIEDVYGVKRVVTYTTRPPRGNEINDIDYHFITDAQYERLRSTEFFAEYASYRGWKYATAKEDCTQDSIIIVTPHGLRQLTSVPDLNIRSFYIYVPRKDRLIKLLQRGDDVEEAYRRNLSDVGQFDGVEDEVDYVVRNPGYKIKPQQIASKIVGVYRNGVV